MNAPESKGFALAELLICLAILGLIAVFSIPKLLQAQQNKTYQSIAKESIGTITTALMTHQMAGSLNTGTLGRDLTQAMNYVSVATTGTIDDKPADTVTLTCKAAAPCVKLHNGSIIQPMEAQSFGGTSSLHFISFTIDPDGVTTGKEDSLRVVLYYNGSITSAYHCKTGSVSSGFTCNPGNNQDPSWFSWQ